MSGFDPNANKPPQQLKIIAAVNGIAVDYRPDNGLFSGALHANRSAKD